MPERRIPWTEEAAKTLPRMAELAKRYLLVMDQMVEDQGMGPLVTPEQLKAFDRKWASRIVLAMMGVLDD